MPEIWDDPGDPIDPIPVDGEGYPAPDAVTSTPIYDEDGFATSNREGKQKLAVKLTVAPEDLGDRERFNQSRQFIYTAYRKLWRAFMLAFRQPFSDNPVLAENVGQDNFCDVFDLLSSGGIAQDFTVTYPSIDGPPVFAPRMQVFDGRNWASLENAVFVSDDGTTGTVQIFLDCELSPDWNGSRIDGSGDSLSALRFFRQAQPFPFPVLPVDPDPLDILSPRQCKHAVRVQHQILSSFADIYPTAPASAGINQDFYCAKTFAASVDLSKFRAVPGLPCNNTKCPLYEAHTAGTPNDGTYSLFLASRDCYMRQLVFGVNTPLQTAFRIGFQGHPGFLNQIGVPVNCYNGPNADAGEMNLHASDGLEGWISFAATAGAWSFRTGDKDSASGYDQFFNFARHCQFLGVDAHDGIGILAAAMADQVDKFDCLEYGSLQERSGMTPLYELEKAIGIRRADGFKVGTMLALGGGGDSKQQRISRGRHYTSARFQLDTPGTFGNRDSGTLSGSAGETTVEIPADAETGKIVFKIPPFTENVTNPTSHETGGRPNPSNMTYSGDEMTVTFELEPLSLRYVGSDPETEAPIDASDTFNCGGNAVDIPVSWQPTNTGNDRVQGCPQAKLSPGWYARFDGDFIDGGAEIWLQCTGAKAMAGTALEGEPGPLADTPGIPAAFRANCTKPDMATFSLTGSDGARMKAYIDSFDPEVNTWRILLGTNRGVSPAASAPTLKLAGPFDSLVTIDPAEYEYKPGLGEFHINPAVCTSPSTPQKLHAIVDVLDLRHTFLAKNAQAMDKLMNALIANGYAPGPALFGGSVVAGYVVEKSPITVWGFDSPISAAGDEKYLITRCYGASEFAYQSAGYLRDPNYFNDGDQTFEGLKIIPDGLFEGSPVPNGIGVVENNSSAKWDGTRPYIEIFGRMNVHAIRGVVSGFGCKTEWIDKAYCDVQIKEAALSATTWDSTTGFTGPSALTEVPIKLFLFANNPDVDSGKFAPVSLDLSLNVADAVPIRTIDGQFVLQATVDITDIVKRMKADAYSSVQFLLVPTIGNFDTSTSFKDILAATISDFAVGGNPTDGITGHITTKLLTWQDSLFSRLLIKYTPEAFADGKTHHDSGGVVQMMNYREGLV